MQDGTSFLETLIKKEYGLISQFEPFDPSELLDVYEEIFESDCRNAHKYFEKILNRIGMYKNKATHYRINVDTKVTICCLLRVEIGRKTK